MINPAALLEFNHTKEQLRKAFLDEEGQNTFDLNIVMQLRGFWKFNT